MQWQNLVVEEGGLTLDPVVVELPNYMLAPHKESQQLSFTHGYTWLIVVIGIIINGTGSKNLCGSLTMRPAKSNFNVTVHTFLS